MSTGGLTQPEWPFCTSTHLICARLGEDEVDPFSGYDSCLGAGVPHVAALALAPDPLDPCLGVEEDGVGRLAVTGHRQLGGNSIGLKSCPNICKITSRATEEKSVTDI